MKKLLLHVCCAPCSTHVIETLKEQYNLTLFFYNPNVEPEEEYELRKSNAEKIAKELNLPIISGNYNNKEWHEAIKGLENEPEGRKRCEICFKVRLKETNKKAKDFDLFTTTLTVSPYKNSEIINKIGKQLSPKYLESNFKKEDGYNKSIQLSKKYNLYRQHYCGCLFSKN